MKKSFVIISYVLSICLSFLGCANYPVPYHFEDEGTIPLNELARIEIDVDLGKLIHIDGKPVNIIPGQKVYLPAGVHWLDYKNITVSGNDSASFPGVENKFEANTDYIIQWGGREMDYINTGRLVPKDGDTVLIIKSNPKSNAIIFIIIDRNYYYGCVFPGDELKIIFPAEHTEHFDNKLPVYLSDANNSIISIVKPDFILGENSPIANKIFTYQVTKSSFGAWYVDFKKISEEDL